MQAGRELDALIAEKVFGLKPCSDPIGQCAGAKTTPVQCWGTGGQGSELRCYSTDIAAAWEVIEKCNSFYLADSIDTHRHKRLYECQIGDGTNAIGTAYSAPLAICIAALNAVGAT